MRCNSRSFNLAAAIISPRPQIRDGPPLTLYRRCLVFRDRSPLSPAPSRPHRLMRVPYERVEQDIYDDEEAFDDRPFEPSKSAFHDSRFPLSPRSSSASSSSSLKSCCINGLTSGRLPLCLVLLLILGFLLWHVETEPRRTQETLASLTTTENHLVEATEQHELASSVHMPARVAGNNHCATSSFSCVRSLFVS